MYDGNSDEENIFGGEIMSTNINEVYTKDYYEKYLGAPDYFHNQSIIAFAKDVAEKIKLRFSPKTVLDVGCANGHFVKALREIGIEAWGIDGSRAAIEAADPSMKRYLGEVIAPFRCLPKHFPQKYDLVISIEVFEHFADEVLDESVKALCDFGDRILFSSTPWAYEDPTHLNIHLPSYWAQLFDSYAFALDPSVDASFVSPQAFCLRKNEAINNERLLFSLLDLHIDVNHRLGQSIGEWRKLADERMSVIESLRKTIEAKDSMLVKLEGLNEEVESIRRKLIDSENDRKAKEKALQEQNESRNQLANQVKDVETALTLTQQTLTGRNAYVQELLERENLLLQEIRANKDKESEVARECAGEVVKITTLMEDEKEKLVKKISSSVSELELQQEIACFQVSELQKLKKVNMQEQEKAEAFRKELQEARTEIAQIINSRSYKLAQKIKRIYHFFKRG